MFPAAGITIWILLGGLIGFIGGKVSRTAGSQGQMANLGVGSLSAVIAGFIVTMFFHGEKSADGWWASIVIAAAAAVAGTALFLIVFPRRAPTIR